MGSGIQDRIEHDHGLPSERATMHYDPNNFFEGRYGETCQVQPAPTKNDNPAVWSLVMKDMLDRDLVGQERYGTRLQPHNGRDTLVDAYQEALDLAVYLRSAIYERDGK